MTTTTFPLAVEIGETLTAAGCQAYQPGGDGYQLLAHVGRDDHLIIRHRREGTLAGFPAAVSNPAYESFHRILRAAGYAVAVQTADGRVVALIIGRDEAAAAAGLRIAQAARH